MQPVNSEIIQKAWVFIVMKKRFNYFFSALSEEKK
jgi:hypothetical protein